MFKKLNDFSYKRTGLEAFGFLLAFALLGMAIGAVSNIVLSTLLQLPMDTFQDGLSTIKRTGKYICLISGIYVSIIYIYVAKSKNCLNRVGSIFSVLISFLLAFLLGGFIGLIPSAIMTTKEGENNISKENQYNKVMPSNEFFAQNNAHNTSLNENTSGKGSNYPVPDAVAKRFNWGAFIFDWIWGLGNKSYITLISLPLWILCFVPKVMSSSLFNILCLGVSIWFGIKGNEWAWQNKHFDSIESFHNYQRKWAIATIIFLLICFCVGIIIGFLATALG